MKTIRVFFGLLVIFSCAIIACDDNGGSKTRVSSTVEGAPLSVFAATDVTHGRELWITDGKEYGSEGATTSLLADINPGVNSGFDTYIYPDLKDEFGYLNGKAYFRAINNDDPTEANRAGYELWVTDGTAAGTHIVKDIYAGSANSSNPQGFTLFNGKLYFAATTADGRELWCTDGTGDGTTRVVEGVFILNFPDDTHYVQMTVFDGKLYFAGYGENGVDLWAVDKKGVAYEIDVTGTGGDSYPEQMTVLDDKLYFTATTGSTGRELFSTDGIPDGSGVISADIVKDIDGTSADSIESFDVSPAMARLTVYNARLYFSADDGALGYELWSTDGTDEGTYCAADINDGSDSSPLNLNVLGGRLYFTASNAGQSRLYVFDSETGAAGEMRLTHTESDTTYTAYSPIFLTVFDSKLFFRADIDSPASLGVEAWVSDGTARGTNMTKNIYTAGDCNPYYFTVLRDRLYFSGTDGSTGHILWTTDGTESGTYQVSGSDCIAPLGSD